MQATPGLEALLASLGVAASDLQGRCNIAPTEQVQLVHDGELVAARWWLTPHWAKSMEQKYAMFNARCERLADSPAFRGPFRNQRGVLPMSSFIEWRGSPGSKQPWLITSPDQALAAAALWDRWEGPEGVVLSCTIVTTDAAPQFRPWHDRMPVLLDSEELPRWLDNATPVETADALFAPRLKTPLLLTPIDRRVGNARNKDEGVLTPSGKTVVLEPGG